jgi:hypothetical protein
MKIKSNLRAGAGANTGGASGGGHNSSDPAPVVVPYVPPVYTPPPYVPPVSRCVGY